MQVYPANKPVYCLSTHYRGETSENKAYTLAPAAFHSTSALKQPASGFYRTQTCVPTTNAAFSKCYGNPPFKNMQLTQANMAGIMATCGYN